MRNTIKKLSIKRISGICLLISTCCVLMACGKSAEQTLPHTAESASGVNSSLFNADITDARVLVFSKTEGWRHDSIPAGIAALEKMAQKNGFTVVATEDSKIFNDAELSKFNAIVFLNTTSDVLNESQEIAMERFIQAGGGFVGIHSAADTEWEGDWYWFRNLVGAVFRSHPNEPSNVQNARVDVINDQHLATQGLPETILLDDEWYDYRDFYALKKDLLKVDESTYMGGLHGDYHPIAWYHEYDGGRSFYTGLGHTSEMFSNSYFLHHLLGGLKYAVGGKPELDYSRSRPENNRFVKKVVVDNLNEPMGFDFFANGDVLIAQRGGKIQHVDAKTGELTEAGEIPVAYLSRPELGLLGVAVDPEFDKNSWIYATFNARKDDYIVQRLARFKWQNGKLDLASEQVLIEYQVDENCCHTGGDIEFGANGELFVSTGDNTNPHDQQGFAPIDSRAAKDDARRGSANTQDLRGKILRIIPTEDGGYTIPEGNLFKDPKDGRPEIYTMGARNPFTLTYDHDSKTLYYGDVGPDASLPSAEQGARGHDEINRITHAANLGWPLIIANNQPYRDYDFETKKAGRLFNPLAPINNSPFNTGLKQLPPAQPAWIWYPYAVSEEFPELGSGGRMALVAELYRSKNFPESQHRYPAYYDNKLFILDGMRSWIKAVSFDDYGRILKIEPFAPQIKYALSMDARFAPDGTLYVLEYGQAWYVGNPDARLSRIEYVGAGNRPPVAALEIDAPQGAAPLQTMASAANTYDPDGDTLSYRWSTTLVGDAATHKVVGEEESVQLNFTDAGVYLVRLEVTDAHGSGSSAEAHVEVGNEPANVVVKVDGNTSFYWPETSSLNYAIDINDAEDGNISANADLQNVLVQFAFTSAEAGGGALGHQQVSAAIVGKELVETNSCTACHQIDAQSIGPAFSAIAERYKDDPKALDYLVKKIGTGGGGVWGSMAMPPFIHLNEEDRAALATYVLSFVGTEKPESLPLKGNLKLDQHQFSKALLNSKTPPTEAEANTLRASYSLSAEYTDKGGDIIGPISVEETLTLLPARRLLSDLGNTEVMPQGVEPKKLQSFDSLSVSPPDHNWITVPLGVYDLTSVKHIDVGRMIGRNSAPWQYQLRLEGADGELLVEADSKDTTKHRYSHDRLSLNTAVDGRHALYLKVRYQGEASSELFLVDLVFLR